MKSHTTASFRHSFNQLSKQMQKQAREAYRHFQANPNYPSLRFKKVHPIQHVLGRDIGQWAFSKQKKKRDGEDALTRR